MRDGSTMGQDEQLRWVKVPRGTRLSNSKDTPGYDRDLLRESGTNKLLGPTESRPANVDELIRSHTPTSPRHSPAKEELGRQLGEVIAKILEPYIELLADRSVDAIVRGASNLRRWAERKTAERRIASREDAAPVPLGAATGPTAEEEAPGQTALKAPPVSMSGEEYRARLLSALAAEHYATEQKRLLASVHVQDDALPEELRNALKAVIDGNTSSLDEDTLAAVVEFLGTARTPEYEYVLALHDEQRPALPIGPDDQADRHLGLLPAAGGSGSPLGVPS